MANYIVKNCPAILKMTKICDAYETTRDLPQLCKDRTDCLIKRIIEKTKNYIDDVEDFSPEELLQMFEIEDCEDADI